MIVELEVEVETEVVEGKIVEVLLLVEVKTEVVDDAIVEVLLLVEVETETVEVVAIVVVSAEPKVTLSFATLYIDLAWANPINARRNAMERIEIPNFRLKCMNIIHHRCLKICCYIAVRWGAMGSLLSQKINIVELRFTYER